MKNKAQVGIIAVCGAYVIGGVAGYIGIVRAERAKRKKIQADSTAEIVALNAAGAVIKDRIERGYYKGVTVNQMMEDFEFETIIQRKS